MLICEGEEIGRDLALVGLLETGQAEGSRLEESRRGIRLGRRLVGVERAAVVFGGSVLVSGMYELVCLLVHASAAVPAWRQLLVSSPPQPTPRYGVVVLCQFLRWRRDLE